MTLHCVTPQAVYAAPAKYDGKIADKFEPKERDQLLPVNVKIQPTTAARPLNMLKVTCCTTQMSKATQNGQLMRMEYSSCMSGPPTCQMHWHHCTQTQSSGQTGIWQV